MTSETIHEDSQRSSTTASEAGGLPLPGATAADRTTAGGDEP